MRCLESCVAKDAILGAGDVGDLLSNHVGNDGTVGKGAERIFKALADRIMGGC